MARRTWEWVDWMRDAGYELKMLAPEGFRSPTVSCIRLPDGAPTGTEVTRRMKARGFTIAAGYGTLKDATFRIGHMGDHSVDELNNLLAELEGVLLMTSPPSDLIADKSRGWLLGPRQDSSFEIVNRPGLTGEDLRAQWLTRCRDCSECHENFASHAHETGRSGDAERESVSTRSMLCCDEHGKRAQCSWKYLSAASGFGLILAWFAVYPLRPS